MVETDNRGREKAAFTKHRCSFGGDDKSGSRHATAAWAVGWLKLQKAALRRFCK